MIALTQLKAILKFCTTNKLFLLISCFLLAYGQWILIVLYVFTESLLLVLYVKAFIVLRNLRGKLVREC